MGVGLTEDAYYYLSIGDNYDFMMIRMDGLMSLGYTRTAANEVGQPDLMPGWDPVAKTLTIVGPQNFDNQRHTNGALYHGTPWIEMNVLP
jgi:hypothetical protein